MSHKKVVLAFSGGLDTTYCDIYLRKNLGMEVHVVTVQTGGFSPEDLQQIELRAQNLGVASFRVVDVTQQYYHTCIRYLIYENVLKNGTYPLSVIAERMNQAIAQPFGIGRDIHVGDTIIGIKGRVGFEAAAPFIILKAHHLLEKHTLTKLRWKEQLAAWYGNWLHEGQMRDPTMRNIERFRKDTQQTCTATEFCILHPYRFNIDGIESVHDHMNTRLGSYGEMNTGWSGEDVRGFAKIFGNQTAIYHKVNANAHD